MIAAFGEHLTKKNLLPESLHRTLLNLYESRVTSDYNVEASPSPEEAKETVEAAAEFTKTIETYLRHWLETGS